MAAEKSTYLESKPRFEILDGLRRVAAVAVILFHILETYSTSPSEQIINHGYLAVDFFFALSGFVIGYAALPRCTPRSEAGASHRNRYT